MEITFRDSATVLHGRFFGALLLLAFTGAGALLTFPPFMDLLQARI
jgi:hypothetical protein